VPVGAVLCIVLLAGVAASVLRDAPRMINVQTSWGDDDFRFRRADVLEKLRAAPGRDLVIVRYGRNHVIHRDWVYNGADIDAADIVWARDMGERNRELLEYYRDRTVWLLRDGFSPSEDGLTPYEK
jgi:hypothetical protein